jgi:hypothetical protein
MTLARWSAFAVCLIVAMAVGVWIGPYVRGHQSGSAVQAVDQTTPPAQQPSQTPPAKSRPSPRARAAATHANVSTISPSAPELHKQLKPLLNKGANMNIAAQDFQNAEQFAAVAHAARNTEIPFVVLKHRVVNERKPLATAIRESKPDVNAVVEAERAQAEARSDLATLAG